MGLAFRSFWFRPPQKLTGREVVGSLEEATDEEDDGNPLNVCVFLVVNAALAVMRAPDKNELGWNRGRLQSGRQGENVLRFPHRPHSVQLLALGRLKFRWEEQVTEISEVHQMKEGFSLFYGIPEGKSKTTGWGRPRGSRQLST